MKYVVKKNCEVDAFLGYLLVWLNHCMFDELCFELSCALWEINHTISVFWKIC